MSCFITFLGFCIDIYLFHLEKTDFENLIKMFFKSTVNNNINREA